MERRKSELNIYVAAGVISLFIFVAGFLIGSYFFNLKTAEIESKNRQIDQLFKNAEVESLLFTFSKGEQKCDFLQRQGDVLLSSLSDIEQRINSIESGQNIDTDAITSVKTDYTLDSLKYFVFVNQLKTECSLNSTTVLYFYSEKCDSCKNEGFILTYFRTTLKNRVLVFPIDVGLNLSSIDVLRNMYNVTSYPTLVINGNVYKGFVDTNELRQIFCENNATEC